MAPESSSRNFQTLPLTIGGSAQTNTMMLSTMLVIRPVVERIEATRNPSTRLEASSTRQTSAVRSRDCQSSGMASTERKLADPTQFHTPTMLVGPTSLNAILISTTSG
jgi:hypothetical protein